MDTMDNPPAGKVNNVGASPPAAGNYGANPSAAVVVNNVGDNPPAAGNVGANPPAAVVVSVVNIVVANPPAAGVLNNVPNPPAAAAAPATDEDDVPFVAATMFLGLALFFLLRPIFDK